VLPPTAPAVINQIVQRLNENPRLSLAIDGFANPVAGTVAELETLRRLSLGRAQQVADVIVSRGIARSRLNITASSGTVLIAPTRDRDDWSRNRRVELSFIQ
jgi:outer membrane protein OmpA-like peptidoglycan-associated protein